MDRERQSDGWLWWCCECRRYTNRAPCEHCQAGFDAIHVVPPGEYPPFGEAWWEEDYPRP